MKSLARRMSTLTLFASLIVLAVVPVAAQPEVDIEKATNGVDADLPPGPILLAGDPVAWTYVVTNTGSRPLTNLVVTDDQSVVVTCPATTLDAGLQLVCTANGTAQEGQYANVGTVTAELPDATPVEDSDPSHYFGQAQLVVTIEKSTEGFDADLPPGPVLAVGSTVGWEYEVTNIGSDPLTDVEVTDDQGVVVTCPQTTLAAGQSITCTASGVVQPGQYANLGQVSALLPSEDSAVDTDPSHYFGQILLLEKSTNGFDADSPPGPGLEAGDPVSWTYEVTNPGPATVTAVTVTDDQGVVVSCPVQTLGAGESVVCTGNGIAEAGQYANLGTAMAMLPAGGEVSASDPSHYFGSVLRIEKSTNGADADSPPGPALAVGAAVSWTYEITNLGSDPLDDVEVTDDQGVVVTCPGTTLAAGESMTCTAAGVAVAGQYANVGTVTAMHPMLAEVAASDPSHYFGQDQVLDFGDAPDSYLTTFGANGARHLLGSAVYLGACVDAELDGQPSAGSDGDDLGAGTSTFGTCSSAGDDEDGITFPAALVVGTNGEVEVVANSPCTLSAWIDFNGDGDFGEANETLFPGGTALAAGSNPLVFAVPAGATVGTRQSRFRCTTDGAVAQAGEASDGEVEDHSVTIFATPASLVASKTDALATDQNANGVADGGDTLLYTVVITNNGAAPAENVLLTDTPGANTTLVAGSVTTTQGTVTSGNGGGDTTVTVDVGTVAGGDSVTITFLVAIDDPLPLGVQQVENQGLVSADDLPDTQTDDPAVAGSADSTATSVVAITVIDIPTLEWWGLLLLLVVIAAWGVRRVGAA